MEASARRVMIASVPPETIIGAWPRRIRLSAWPSASVPEAQAVLMVVLGPRRPSSRAMRAAPMCWPERVMIIGSARIGPFCTMSMYGAPRSNASPEVAMTTPICSRSSGSARSTPCVDQRLLAGGDGELHEARAAARRLAVQVVGRVEVLHLAGDLHGQVGGVDDGDGRDAVAAGAQPLPVARQVVADGCDGAEAGDEDFVEFAWHQDGPVVRLWRNSRMCCPRAPGWSDGTACPASSIKETREPGMRRWEALDRLGG